MMIPVDFKLFKAFRSFNEQRFIYTRYADDFIISSKYDFDVHAKDQRDLFQSHGRGTEPNRTEDGVDGRSQYECLHSEDVY